MKVLVLVVELLKSAPFKQTSAEQPFHVLVKSKPWNVLINGKDTKDVHPDQAPLKSVEAHAWYQLKVVILTKSAKVPCKLVNDEPFRTSTLVIASLLASIWKWVMGSSLQAVYVPSPLSSIVTVPPTTFLSVGAVGVVINIKNDLVGAAEPVTSFWKGSAYIKPCISLIIFSLFLRCVNLFDRRHL